MSLATTLAFCALCAKFHWSKRNQGSKADKEIIYISLPSFRAVEDSHGFAAEETAEAYCILSRQEAKQRLKMSLKCSTTIATFMVANNASKFCFVMTNRGRPRKSRVAMKSVTPWNIHLEARERLYSHWTKPMVPMVECWMIHLCFWYENKICTYKY